jgi:hypothetical protein
MMDEAPRRIYVGSLPHAGEIYANGPDPLVVMIEAANAQFDRERAEDERARQAKLADEARAVKAAPGWIKRLFSHGQ